jgi:adenylate kinase family enzyme
MQSKERLTSTRQSGWQRFHIMGGAGGGKTTLARQISERLGCPCYHLDQIGWNQEGKRSLPDRLIDIERIIAKPTWVSEGVFLWWTEQLLEKADVIVWLDLPLRITEWRIARRHIQLSLAGTNPHAGTLNLLRFMWGVYQGNKTKTPLIPKAPDDDFAITRIATQQILTGYTDKLVHCRSPRDVKRLLAHITLGTEDGSQL